MSLFYQNEVQELAAAKAREDELFKLVKEALNFSKEQLALYSDLSLSSLQQSWDPLEHANNWTLIREKRAATLRVRRLYDDLQEARYQR